jgi:phage tail tape-measure protein
VTNGTNDAAANWRVIHATCSTHGGSTGFTNLVLRKLGGEIELDPHATGACVIRLDEDAATAVRDQLSAWLG